MKPILFCERFNEILKTCGLTQREIAKRCHIYKTNISQYKNGETQPTLQVLMNLCEVLDVSADYLLGLTDEY